MEKTGILREGMQLVWIYPDPLSGLLHIAPRLEMTRELRKIGWQVTFLAAGPPGNHVIDGVALTCLPRPDLYILGQLIFHSRILLYLIRRWESTDFVLFHQTSLPFVLILQLLQFWKGRNRPLLVMDTRTVPMEREERTLKDRIRGQYTLLMNALANRLIDGQVAITRRMAEVLRIPEKKLWGVYPSGVDIDRFLAAREKRTWPKGNEPVRIIYLGIFARERNLKTLCHAIVQANQAGMCFELSLVGSGRQWDELADIASRSGGIIRLISQVPHDQVPEILAQMHAGALPFPDAPEFRVSSPIKLFEYMGSGMPVLATRIACHTDVIGDQPCAFWAEDASVEGCLAALRQIWDGRAHLAEMGDAAVEIAREYTWSASAKKLSAALEYGLVAASGGIRHAVEVRNRLS